MIQLHKVEDSGNFHLANYSMPRS